MKPIPSIVSQLPVTYCTDAELVYKNKVPGEVVRRMNNVIAEALFPCEWRISATKCNIKFSLAIRLSIRHDKY